LKEIINSITIYELTTIMISLLALSLSIFNIWNNRKRLNVVIEKKIGFYEKLITKHGEINEPGLSCHVKIVNPSSKDIAYFDLTVIDKETKELIPVMYRIGLVLNEQDFIYTQVGDFEAHVNAPQSNYGILKSNSFTKIDLLFSPEEKTKEVRVQFKVALTDPLSFTRIRKTGLTNYRRSFRIYRRDYELPLTEKKS